MSHENLIGAMYKAWSEGDLDALLETCDPEVEFLTSGSFPDLEPVYRGHDGLRNFWDAMRAPWELLHLHVERIVEGEDRAAVVVRFRARGRGSGVVTDLYQGHAMRFTNGRVMKFSAHTSFEQALEAVGLSEQTPTPPNRSQPIGADQPTTPADALQLSRASIERWNDGDMAGIYDLWDNDIVVRPDPEFPEGVCFGREAAQRFWEGYREAMGPAPGEIQEEHDLGSVCLSRINHPVHSPSGVESTFEWSFIVTAREDKIVMAEFFIDHARALAALGLESA